MSTKYTIGLDYGTNSVRALIVNVANGAEVGTAVWIYAHGTQGVILSHDPNLARQDPADYIAGAEITIKQALAAAKKSVKGFSADQVIGIGVDTTGSTPLPVDANGQPLVYQKKFANNPAAMAWLWKDHTGVAEAAEITALAKKMRPQFLAKCGGIYSSEWFFSKVLHCLRTAPEVFNAAYSWIELSDFVPADLTGTLAPDKFIAGVCAAGHKAMFNAKWGGYPDEKFLGKLDPKLAALRSRLTPRVHTIDRAVGGLTGAWAKKTGLKAGIPVVVGAFDCHLGAVGAGVTPGTLVKIIGTSTCDISVRQNTAKLADVPGVCGIVDGSVLPGYFGIEAGQSAVGDLFNWWVNYIQPHGEKLTHRKLDEEAYKTSARRKWLARAGLEQWQPHDPRGPAANRFAGWPDALLDARGSVSRAHRGDGVRRAHHHQPDGRIRREDFADRQLRRHRGEERHHDADLRRRDGPADEDFALGADLRARLGHRGGGHCRRAQGLRHGAEENDRLEAENLQAESEGT